MNDLVLTSVAFFVTTITVWLCTRRDLKVMANWRRPVWPVLRIAVLFASLHALLVAASVPLAYGYLFLIVFVLVSLTGLFLDAFAVLLVITLWLFYEWVFWFPSVEELVPPTAPETTRKPLNGDRVDGRVAETVTDLVPLGRVSIDGVIREARSSFGFIAKGETVEVVSSFPFELVVNKRERAGSAVDTTGTGLEPPTPT